jgi:hypothetical protein
MKQVQEEVNTIIKEGFIQQDASINKRLAEVRQADPR